MSAIDKNETGLIPVLVAVSGNAIIAIAKFIGFMLSGSATLFAETIHSVADVANQALLFVGIKRSQKAPDEIHMYGYGQERFFWALVSACGVFFIGAGITVYHGIHTLLAEATEVHVGYVTVGLLLLSFVLESVSVGIAIRELKGDHPTFKDAFTKGDPSTIAIVYEDGVALLGILIALLSLYLTSVTGETYWDAIGSIVVGFLLGIMAIILINKNRKYLIEKAMPTDTRDKTLAVLQELDIINSVVDFKSTTVSLDEYRIAFEAKLNVDALVAQLFGDAQMEATLAGLKTVEDLKNYSKDVAMAVTEAIGKHIDRIEATVREKIPSVQHIDIELK
jgi:zinc transporter 9